MSNNYSALLDHLLDGNDLTEAEASGRPWIPWAPAGTIRAA
jgi:hypothetical protein